MPEVNFVFFEEIDSTSLYLRREKDNIPSNTVVSAAFQTAGRGRGTNTWKCDRDGGALFSILLDRNPNDSIELVSHTALQTAEVIVGWLNRKLSLKADIKHPNDILVEGKKLCGILVEEAGTKIIVGVGLNTNNAPDKLEKSYSAVSLSSIFEGTRFDNRELIEELSREIIEGLSSL